MPIYRVSKRNLYRERVGSLERQTDFVTAKMVPSISLALTLSLCARRRRTDAKDFSFPREISAQSLLHPHHQNSVARVSL